jgi:hypothetical protein
VCARVPPLAAARVAPHTSSARPPNPHRYGERTTLWCVRQYRILLRSSSSSLPQWRSSWG